MMTFTIDNLKAEFPLKFKALRYVTPQGMCRRV